MDFFKTGGSLRIKKKVLNPDGVEELNDAPQKSKRISLFGITGLLRRVKGNKESATDEDVASSEPQSNASESTVTISSDTKEASDSSGKITLGRQGRSMSMSNLRHRMSIGGGRPPDLAHDADKISSPAKKIDLVDTVEGSSSATSLVAEKGPKVYVVPANRPADAERLLETLATGRETLKKMVGPETKGGNKQLMRTQQSLVSEGGSGGSGGGRARAGSLSVTLGSAPNTVRILEAASFLGESVSMLMTSLEERSSILWARETVARLKALEGVMKPEYDRPDDGKDWKESFRRFSTGVYRVFTALEEHLKNWESPLLRARVRGSLDELQGAGYFVKGLVASVLVDTSCEDILTNTMQSVVYWLNMASTKLLKETSGKVPDVLRGLIDGVDSLRLAVMVVASVSCTREGRMALGHRIRACISANDAVIAHVEQNFSESVAPKLGASFRRLRNALQDVEYAVRTSISAVKVKIMSNTDTIVKLLGTSEKLVMMLQRSTDSSSLSNVRDPVSQLSSYCEGIRGGLLSASKVQHTVWSEVHAAQKKVLADAMLCERAGRPFLSADEVQGNARETAVDALLLSTIRLVASIKSFLATHVVSDTSPDSLTAAGVLISAAMSRVHARALLAKTLFVCTSLESQLHRVSGESQRRLFIAIGTAFGACHDVLNALDVLDGVHMRLSDVPDWQRLLPTEQLIVLPLLWNVHRQTLIDTADNLHNQYQMSQSDIPDDIQSVLAGTIVHLSKKQ